MKVAIVGGGKWTSAQKAQVKQNIRGILADYNTSILVSGHCPGVDIWAEEVALERKIHTEIYTPEVHQWWDRKLPDGDKLIGYRSRNILIAQACDILYDIEPQCLWCKGRGYYLGVEHFEPEKGIELFETVKCKNCRGTGFIRSGGTWTLDYAKKLGKEVRLVRV